MGKYCSRCGNQISETAKFCGRCGAKNVVAVNNTVQTPVVNNQSINSSYNPINNNYNNDNVIYTPKTNNVAVCSLIASIVGIFIMSMYMRNICYYMWYRGNK